MIDFSELDYKLPPELLSETKEHYQLLARACEDKELVFDVGTYRGFSAYAMGITAKKVISFDIEDKKELTKDNVEYLIEPDFTTHSLIHKAEVILIDVDPHDGIKERNFIDELSMIKWHGIVVLDDIKLMKPLWDYLKNEYHSYDATEYGHYTGTGILFL
jgi:predicted O-methyltransferase YrrM